MYTISFPNLSLQGKIDGKLQHKEGNYTLKKEQENILLFIWELSPLTFRDIKDK
jgi:hypothetical protein